MGSNVEEARSVLGNLNINCAIEKQNVSKNKNTLISDSKKESVKKPKSKFDPLEKANRNLEKSVKSAQVNRCETASVNDLALSIENLSICEDKAQGILEEFENLAIDDEISNISGVIQGIVGEAYYCNYD